MITRTWEGRTVVLIASGPSLTKEQCKIVKLYHSREKIKVAGCSDAYRIYPKLDLLYAADKNWWNVHINNIKKLTIPERCIPDESFANAHGITFIKGKGGNKLSTDPACIAYGGNSGFQLFNIAVLKGAKKIILLGYDYTYLNNKAHWFGSHSKGMRNPPPDMKRWLSAYDDSVGILSQEGIEVINCSTISKIICFPKMEIWDALRKV